MRRLFFVLVATILVSTLLLSVASADSINVAGFLTKTIAHEVNERTPLATPQWYLDWQELNPKVKLKADETIPYKTTSAVLKALRGKQMKYDVLMLNTRTFEWLSIASSDKLLDLSTDQELVSLVQQMYPLFANTVYHNDQLLGVPCGVSISFLSYDSAAWSLAGYSQDDVPSSFLSFVEFLDDWADRCSLSPNNDVCVTNTFDRVSETSYTQWLTGLLVQYYVDQCFAQGIELSFNTPDILYLLDRISEVGAKLYAYDNPTNNNSLFFTSGDFKQIPYIIPTRIADDDPMCIPVTIDIMCVPKASKNKEYALQLLHLYMDCIHNRTYDYSTTTAADTLAMLANGLLFEGVTDAIPSFDYGKAERNRQNLENQRAKLADNSLSERERENARSIIESYETSDYLSVLEKQEWQLTSEELATYKTLTEFMRIQDGSSNVVGSKTTRTLITQFASGKITAQEFVKRMDAQLK